MVNHKDENTANNQVDNLEWCTIKYNNGYGTKCERLSKTAKENPIYAETIVKAREKRRKPVLCIETGIAYRSIAEAAKQTGADRSCIAFACSGKIKTAGGYRWKFMT